MPSLSDILYALRYQILTPQVTTMGPCEVDGCKNSARGGGMCASCREDQLAELLGSPTCAAGYVHKLRESRRLLWEAEDMAYEMETQEKING